VAIVPYFIQECWLEHRYFFALAWPTQVLSITPKNTLRFQSSCQFNYKRIDWWNHLLVWQLISIILYCDIRDVVNMKSSSINKSYYMIVKLFLCYDVTYVNQTNKNEFKKSKYRKYWWTEIQIQQIYKTMHVLISNHIEIFY
jgi:hypothetical protein